jgi:acetyl-CoA carboxylase/biotin carboxylase 1
MSLVNGVSAANGQGSSATASYNLPSHFIGGNHLEAASPSSVKDFVATHGGHSVITSVSTPERKPIEL